MDGRDPEAFRVLYRAHYATVCRYLAARVDRDVVEDVAAEVFVVAWRRQSELPDRVVPWLLNTAAKCLANQRRARERSAALVERISGVLTSCGPGIEDAVVRGGQQRALLAALASLDERDLELLMLRHWDGLAPRELSVVLDLSPVVVRARLYRAGRRLQRALIAALEYEDVRPGVLELTET